MQERMAGAVGEGSGGGPCLMPEVLHLTVSVYFPRLLPLGHILAEEMRGGG